MERHRQTKEELFSNLSEVKTDWKDSFAESFIQYMNQENLEFPIDSHNLKTLLSKDFDLGVTFLRLSIEQSKDEFQESLKAIFFENEEGSRKKAFLKSPDFYVDKLIEYGILASLNDLISKQYSWKDIILERLKMGRGSAIKGQKRGKFLEDFVENLVIEVFGEYAVRKSFVGANGFSTAKADFCIPSTLNPNIVIEVKAYGATGSKQSDVIGDVEKIIAEKRNDTYFLLVTDGISWKSRAKDFERLIEFQNHGKIYRIYTQLMESQLQADLTQLKSELKL